MTISKDNISAPLGTVDQMERSHIDLQVATARAYPRDLARVKKTVIDIITMDIAVAESCGYAVSGGGENVTGMSVHLARLLAQNFGNIRAESKVVEITDSEVVSRGTAWDLESNYAVSYEVRRSIMDKAGIRLSDDMITVTGNAANAIAYRNAVLAVIPRALSDAAYEAAQKMVADAMGSSEKLETRRKKAFSGLYRTYRITQAEVLALIGKKTIAQVDAKALSVLLKYEQSLKDGDTTAEELMADIRKANMKNKKSELRKKQSKGKASKHGML